MEAVNLYGVIPGSKKLIIPHHIVVWDYLGYRTTDDFFTTQREWNRTLITKINQISAKVYNNGNELGGANIIEVSSEFLPIIDLLDFYEPVSSILCGKYNVIINDEVPFDSVLVYNNSNKTEIGGNSYGIVKVINFSI